MNVVGAIVGTADGSLVGEREVGELDGVIVGTFVGVPDGK